MGPFLRVDLFVTSKPDGWRAVPAEIEMGGVETKGSMRTVDVAGPGEASHAVVFARSRDQAALRPVLSAIRAWPPPVCPPTRREQAPRCRSGGARQSPLL